MKCKAHSVVEEVEDAEVDGRTVSEVGQAGGVDDAVPPREKS